MIRDSLKNLTVAGLAVFCGFGCSTLDSLGGYNRPVPSQDPQNSREVAAYRETIARQTAALASMREDLRVLQHNQQTLTNALNDIRTEKTASGADAARLRKRIKTLEERVSAMDTAWR